MKKVIRLLEEAGRRRIWLIRGFCLKIFLKLHGCRVGRKLKCKQWPIFRAFPHKNMEFGNFVSIGYRITFEPVGEGKIILGDYVQLTQDILISAMTQVQLEDYVGISEFVSIRDSDHEIKKGNIPHFQPMISSPILIKKGAGVGRGSAIFRGALVQEGAVIGANCIIMRNAEIIPYGIYFGTPPKLIGKRQ